MTEIFLQWSKWLGPYSLQATTKYHIRYTTKNLNVPYFVKDTFNINDFSLEFRRQLESNIEEEYLNLLMDACFSEKSYKEYLLWQARSSGNSNLLKRGHKYATPSCDQLEKIHTTKRWLIIDAYLIFYNFQSTDGISDCKVCWFFKNLHHQKMIAYFIIYKALTE